MYPHGRLLLASAVFSGSLGLMIAIASIGAGLIEAARDKAAMVDDSALHAVSILLFVVAPLVAILSLAISVPASYVQWRRRNIGTGAIVLTSVVLAFSVVIPILLPGSTIPAVLVLGSILSLSLVLSCFLWRAVMPRSDTSSERARER